MNDWVTRTGRVWTFQLPVSEVRKRGLVNLLLVPFLCALLSALLMLMFGPGSEWVWVPLCGLGALAGVAQGLRLLLTAPRRSLESRVVYDLERNELDGVPLAPVQKIVVLQPSTWLKFLELRVVTTEGERTLVEKIGPKQGAEALALARSLAAQLEVPAEDIGGVTDTGSLGLTDKHAATACYFPVQGIFLIASLFFLVFGGQRPRVRFHAIQSLTVFGLFLLALGLAVGAGAALMLVDEGLGAAVMVLGLLGVALPRLGLRFLLCWKAWNQELWIVPGLGSWMRRWLP
jgi:uncharacterized membrane protein